MDLKAYGGDDNDNDYDTMTMMTPRQLKNKSTKDIKRYWNDEVRFFDREYQRS